MKNKFIYASLIALSIIGGTVLLQFDHFLFNSSTIDHLYSINRVDDGVKHPSKIILPSTSINTDKKVEIKISDATHEDPNFKLTNSRDLASTSKSELLGIIDGRWEVLKISWENQNPPKSSSSNVSDAEFAHQDSNDLELSSGKSHSMRPRYFSGQEREAIKGEVYGSIERIENYNNHEGEQVEAYQMAIEKDGELLEFPPIERINKNKFGYLEDEKWQQVYFELSGESSKTRLTLRFQQGKWKNYSMIFVKDLNSYYETTQYQDGQLDDEEEKDELLSNEVPYEIEENPGVETKELDTHNPSEDEKPFIEDGGSEEDNN